MQSVRDIAQEIIAREGGYVNDPDDPGGATSFGITIHTLRRLGIDLDGDGQVSAADVRALDRGRAEDILLRHYFHAPRIAALPETLQAPVFDMQVNAGANAVKILQRLLSRMGYALADDGVIGPRTERAAHAAAEVDANALRDAYGVARRNYYFRLADRRPASRKYARTRVGGKGGWILRAERFLSPRYRLSQVEFDRRVAGWV